MSNSTSYDSPASPVRFSGPPSVATGSSLRMPSPSELSRLQRDWKETPGTIEKLANL